MLRVVLVEMLELGVGIKFTIHGLGHSVYVQDRESGQYEVGGIDEIKPNAVESWNYARDSAEQVVDIFMAKRHQYGIGADYPSGWRMKQKVIRALND
jgi:hypothetical protein